MRAGARMPLDLRLRRFALALALTGAAFAPPARPAIAQESNVTPLTLDALIERAYGNEDVTAALAQRDFYIGKRLEARSYSWPKFDVTTIFSGPVPEARGNQFGVTDASERGNFQFGEIGYVYRADLLGTWPLYTFGKLESAEKAGEYGEKAATENIEIVRARVRANVRKVYWGLLTARSIVRILDEARGKIEDARRKVDELLAAESAQVNDTDRHRVGYFSATSENLHAEAVEAEQDAAALLRFLCRLDAEIVPQIVENEVGENLPAATPVEQALTAARTNRPEIKALRNAMLARKFLVDTARAGYWPDLFLGGFLRYSYSNVTDDQTNPFVRDDFNYLEGAIGVGLKMSFDIPFKSSKVLQAEAEWHQSQAQYDMIVRGVEIEVRRKARQLDTKWAKLQNDERALKAAKAWFIGEGMQYSIGIGETRSLIEGLAAYYGARVQYLRSANSLRSAAIELDQAIGN